MNFTKQKLLKRTVILCESSMQEGIIQPYTLRNKFREILPWEAAKQSNSHYHTMKPHPRQKNSFVQEENGTSSFSCSSDLPTQATSGWVYMTEGTQL